MTCVLSGAGKRVMPDGQIGLRNHIAQMFISQSSLKVSQEFADDSFNKVITLTLNDGAENIPAIRVFWFR